MGVNIDLTPQLEVMVREKVSSGLYSSVSDVVRDALRMMEEEDRLQAARLEQLRREMRAGFVGPAATGLQREWGQDERRQTNSVATVDKRAKRRSAA